MAHLIVEGIEGRWRYHLRGEARSGPALCGASVMPTSIPLSYWGKTPADYHLPEKWCAACANKSGVPSLSAVLEQQAPARVLRLR